MSNCIRWVSETAVNISLLNTSQKDEEKSQQGWIARIASIAWEALAMLCAAFQYFSNNYNEENLVIRREIRDLMKNAGISAPGNFTMRALEGNFYARSIGQVMRDLHRARLLTQENFNAVMSGTNAYSSRISGAIQSLHQANLLTQENFNAIAVGGGACAGGISEAIKSLHRTPDYPHVDLLTEENRNSILVGGGVHAVGVARAIRSLHNLRLLTLENRKAILVRDGAYAENIARAIRNLHGSKLWTSENRKALLVGDGEHAVVLDAVIRRLDTAHLLTPENLKAALVGDESRASKLCDLLESWYSGLNQEIFDGMIRKIEEWECVKIATILGRWNGRLPDSEHDLRLPPEVIGNIAELETVHGGPNEYREKAIRLAEREEQRLLASLEQSAANL